MFRWPVIFTRSTFCDILGNTKDAAALFNSVIKDKAVDSQTVAAAANNIICINKVCYNYN